MTSQPARLRKAVLPVAGLGTRVLPGTKTTPKELLNVVDRPILSYIVEEAREAGIEHIVFVTGRSKGAIEDYFDHQIELESQLEAKGKLEILEQLRAELPTPGEMSFTRQMSPKGLGHAVWCARDIIGREPFAVLLPDVIVDSQPGALTALTSGLSADLASELATGLGIGHYRSDIYVTTGRDRPAPGALTVVADDASGAQAHHRRGAALIEAMAWTRD
ncbi:hypothetical protein LTR94_025661, partial [Friedmanniomyces endolithicus]